eukprot:symbB.v1.2.009937.t1/scaffold640.1/size177612/20
MQSNPRMRSQASTRSVLRESPSKKKSGGSRKSVAVNSNFIKAKTRSLDLGVGDGIGPLAKAKLVAAKALQSKYFVNSMALVVLIDAYCTCWDIDARAAKEVKAGIAQTLSDICLALYTIELAMGFLVSGWNLFKDWAVLVDLAVVLCGFLEVILSATRLVDGMFESVGILRVLRIMRIVRLSRLLRKTRTLRELQKLVRMMATCLKALFWSFVFCFMIMTVWAMLMVEWIYPCVESMYENTDAFVDCGEYCLQATSSVMHANLLLFKTVIAGDSWGLIAVPVIQQHPATAVIFMGSLLTLVFGVLNLIVAVVVDNFAEARQRDVLNLAEEMEDNLDKDTRLLEAIFQRIDEDGSGQVTFEELKEGAHKDKEFQSRLRVMDIDEADLQQLFEMIDTTGEGSIGASQFIAPMTRWVHDSKTAPRFIKYNMLRTLHQQEEFFNMSQDYLEALSCRMDLIAEKLGLDTFPEEEFASSFLGDTQGPRKWSPTRQISPMLGRQQSKQSGTASVSPQRSWNLSPRRFGHGPANRSRGASKEQAVSSQEIIDPADQEASKEENLELGTVEDNTENEGVEQPRSSTKMSIGKDEEQRALGAKVLDQDSSLKVAMQKPCRTEHQKVDTDLITRIYFGCLNACIRRLKRLWGVCSGEGQMKQALIAEDCDQEVKNFWVTKSALRNLEERSAGIVRLKLMYHTIYDGRQGIRTNPTQEALQGHRPTGHLLVVSVLLPGALRL